MKWIILAAVLTVAAAVPFHACPSNVKKAIDTCMSHVTGSRSGNMYDLMNDLQSTLQYCRDDALALTIDCLNQLYNQCAMKQTNAKELVTQAKQWESAISLLCQNRGYLENNMQCDARAMPQFNGCLARETMELKNKVEALDQNRGLSHSQKTEAKLSMACLFHSKIENCLRQPLEQHCSSHITDLLMDVLDKFKPDVCAHHEPATSTTTLAPARGPAYEKSPRDQHNKDYQRGDANSREDLIISIPGRPGHMGGDVDDNGEKDDRDFFELHGARGGSRGDRPDDRKESIFQGPGAVAQTKESDSDKDGAAGVHSVSGKIGLLLAVAVSALIVVTGRLV